MVRVESLDFQLWKIVYMRRLLAITLGYMTKFADEFSALFPFNFMLAKTTEAMAHGPVFLQDSILAYEMDNEYSCKNTRDFSGYPKLLTSPMHNHTRLVGI